MNGAEQWQANNEAYLAAALKWLRLVLLAAAEKFSASRPQPAASKPGEQPVAAESGWWIFKKTEPARAPVALLPEAIIGRVSEEDIAKAAAAMRETEDSEPPPALVILGNRFRLSRFERQILLLCAAMELDTRTAALCARAQDDPSKPYPTFALALALLDEPAWDALTADRPLRYWRLIEINQPGAQPLTSSALRADERIVNFIKGLNEVDDSLSTLLMPLTPSVVKLPDSQTAQVEAILRCLKNSPAAPVIQLPGFDQVSKRLIAAEVAAAAGLQLFKLPVESLPAHAAELETFTRLWRRERFLSPVALYIDAYEAERAGQAGATEVSTTRAAPLNRFLSRNQGLCFLDTREAWPGLGEAGFTFDIANPTPAEQQAEWAEALGEMAGAAPRALAGQFNLDVMTIDRVAQMALAESTANSGESKEEVFDNAWRLCLSASRPRLESLAPRLDAKATWDDIVLPEDTASSLRQIADQARNRMQVYEAWEFRRRMNRGLGINALFAGESGTGKTMAAEVIANDLKLDLYRIDLSQVVSKYIGETEKNLRQLFDRAENGGALLFFDEADALFGKRSEVKDSHDRYANIEINYLLQRTEAYSGLAILATNMKSALDTAFMRRLRFIVTFPFPGVAERKLMWRKAWPDAIPKDGLDFDRLARLNLTGGSIHNIAINAAFLAVRSQPQVLTMPLVFEAARAEFRKLERPFNEADFK